LTDKVEHTAGDDWWEALDRFETIVEKAQKK
jgi:hypothetical protein